eukprot:679349-Lingulodinium_polyedra.AAC.1
MAASNPRATRTPSPAAIPQAKTSRSGRSGNPGQPAGAPLASWTGGGQSGGCLAEIAVRGAQQTGRATRLDHLGQ